MLALYNLISQGPTCYDLTWQQAGLSEEPLTDLYTLYRANQMCLCFPLRGGGNGIASSWGEG